ncbi:MAG: iron ABC transporter permease [Legionellales bacterium]|nr:iron ABC transporter permease [Legionellales bacterium]
MDSLSSKYEDKNRDHVVKILLLGLCTIVIAIFALGQGSSVNLDMLTTAKILLQIEEGSEIQRLILWEYRVPRVVFAIIAGIGLAVAGALMQGALGNPLVSPLTLGVASGAALGAAFAIFLDLTFVSELLAVLWSGVTAIIPVMPVISFVGSDLVLNAFFFALFVVYIIIKLGSVRGVTAESYILVGIAITFIAGAIVQTMVYFATAEELSQLTHWSFGSLARVDSREVWLIGGVVIFLVPKALEWSWDLNSLSIGGDEFAISTGVDPVDTRKKILVLSSLLTALIISFTGMIGFVGLAAPHMSRLIIGNDYRKLIPCSAIFGALLMLIADTIGRTIIAPVVLPVGLMLSVVGGPLFIYLLLTNRGGH